MHVRSAKYKEDEELMACYAKALGHPARIAILKILAKSESCYCGDIVDELPIAQATVSQHLKELKNAGLITGTIESPKICYCINRNAWKKVSHLFSTFFK